MMKSKPLAVLISDVHFNLKTKDLAAKAVSLALGSAECLNVPLIVAGDLHDTKDMLRGVCVATMINVFKDATVPIKVLIGNHDKVHEKSDAHALEFLRPYVQIIDSPGYDRDLKLGFIPYQSSNRAFLIALQEFAPGTTLIVHQGFMGAAMGEYVKDDSSVSPEEVKAFRVISGHYHKHQSLGTITYIGTPYTTTFAEALDGPKGFLILYADGSIEQVSTGLRRHVIIERTLETLYDKVFESVSKDDILWLKVEGSSVELNKLDKKLVGMKLFGHQSFKLDKICTDVEPIKMNTDDMTDDQMIDSMIDQENETLSNKAFLKELWRDILQ